MLKVFRSITTAMMLASGLGGCVGAAGVSTWEYRSGPGFETEQVRESRIQADTSQGVTGEACSRVSRRQVDPSGAVSGSDVAECR
jgi:hypothetical protein